MSPAIGDNFPPKFRKEFSSRNVKIGAVIKTHVTDTTPPKEKRFVIIAFDAAKILAATLYINSEINPKKFPSKELQELHLLLEEKTYKFIEYDSYLDCSYLHEKELTELKRILEED